MPLTGFQQVTWPTTQACALIRDWTRDLSVCGTTPNPLSHTSQGIQRLISVVALHCLSARTLRLHNVHSCILHYLDAQTSITVITWELVRNAECQALPLTYWIRIFFLIRSPGTLHVKAGGSKTIYTLF